MTTERVLHVFRYFRPRFTGEGVFVERLAPIFARLRPDMAHEVLVTSTPAPAAEPTAPGLAKIHYLTKSPDREASQAALVAWLCRNGRHYSVVHHHTHVDRTFMGALWLRLTHRRQILSATLDDSLPGLLATYRPSRRPLVRRLLGLIDRFVAISPKLFEQNLEEAPEAKCALVPMGVPLPNTAASGREAGRIALGVGPETTVLLSVGGICERKDQLFLAQQLPALLANHPELLLLLVGPMLEPAYQARIEAFISQHGLEARVRLQGYSERPSDYYDIADIFVFASQEEGFGTVAIEAMAHGLPVVARRLPGVNDSFIEDGHNGCLFTDADGYQHAVSTLLQSSPRRRRMGDEARRFVSTRHDINDVAARYLQLYDLAT